MNGLSYHLVHLLHTNQIVISNDILLQHEISCATCVYTLCEPQLYLTLIENSEHIQKLQQVNIILSEQDCKTTETQLYEIEEITSNTVSYT